MATPDCENFQCCCCLDDLKDTDKDVSITKCGHRMHTSCLIKWVSTSRNKTCPLCRSNMIDDDDVANDDETNPPSSTHQIPPPTTTINRLEPIITTIVNHNAIITNDHIPINETNPQTVSSPRSIVHTFIRNPNILNTLSSTRRLRLISRLNEMGDDARSAVLRSVVAAAQVNPSDWGAGRTW